MTTETGERRQAVVVGPGEGEAVWFLNSRMTVKATGASTGGRYGLLESTIPPGFSPPLGRGSWTPERALMHPGL